MNDFVTRRQQLIPMRTMETNRSHQTNQKNIIKSIEKVVNTLNKQSDDIDIRIKKMVDANPDWSEKDKILQSVPGVGAIKWNQQLKTFYERLIEKGKKRKAALVATLRKLITILNVMIKTKTPWKEHRVSSEKC